LAGRTLFSQNLAIIYYFHNIFIMGADRLTILAVENKALLW